MSDIPALIAEIRATAAKMAKENAAYHAAQVLRWADALEAEHARAEEFRGQRNALDDELTKAQARIAALEVALDHVRSKLHAHNRSDNIYRSLRIELREYIDAELEKADE